MKNGPRTEPQSTLHGWKYDVGEAEWHMYLCVPGTSGRMAGEPPVTRAAFIRSFGSIVYFPIVGSAFSLPLKLYGEMDSLARRV